MSIFGQKGHISRNEFRQALRRDSGSIPHSRQSFTKKERVAFEKEVFGKKLGSLISKRDYQQAVGSLAKQKSQAKSEAEKWAIRRKVGYLKKLIEPSDR